MKKQLTFEESAFLQQWFQLSDEAAEEALYDTTSMRTFAGISLGTDTVPDEKQIAAQR